jgi:hypothetical protein
VASLGLEGLRARLQDYDRPEHSSFATIVIGDSNLFPELPDKLNEMLPYFAKRSAPHLYFVDARDSFSKIVAEALDGLRLEVVNNPQAPNIIGNPTEFHCVPGIGGPGQPQTAP